MKKLLLALLFFAFCLTAQAQKNFADLIIINADVRTMDAARPRAEAFAVSGNKISAVGTNAQIRALAGSDTKTIDARGRLVLPGFNDSHVHFAGIGNEFFSIDLRDAASPAEMLEKISFYARFLPKGSWILGGGWNYENRKASELPTKDLIDAATPEHPVFIYSADAKMALANSLALKKAGIGRNFREIEGGEIVRNAQGEPTGILKGKAIDLVKNLPPRFPTKNLSLVLETASSYAASLGVTSVQDVHSDDIAEVLQKLAREGKLKTRVYECISLADWRKLAQAGVRSAAGDEMVRRGCLKHFADGDPQEFSELYEKIAEADRVGLQVMIHAIGAGANDLILNVYEKILRTNGARDRRFRVEHAHRMRIENVRRFSRLKIVASMQPHLFLGGTFDGTEPYRALLDSGASLAFGSDASISDFNPLLGIEAAVTRGKGRNNQAISVEEAVRAYTVGSAFAEFQENVKGTITAGKLADFVILSDNIFTIQPDRIGKTKVLLTVMDGKIVYQDD
jgi:Predicted metal-dependent hydrolase with the TIM-barrel fold